MIAFKLFGLLKFIQQNHNWTLFNLGQNTASETAERGRGRAYCSRNLMTWGKCTVEMKFGISEYLWFFDGVSVVNTEFTKFVLKDRKVCVS